MHTFNSEIWLSHDSLYELIGSRWPRYPEGSDKKEEIIPPMTVSSLLEVCCNKDAPSIQEEITTVKSKDIRKVIATSDLFRNGWKCSLDLSDLLATLRDEKSAIYGIYWRLPQSEITRRNPVSVGISGGKSEWDELSECVSAFTVVRECATKWCNAATFYWYIKRSSI